MTERTSLNFLNKKRHYDIRHGYLDFLQNERFSNQETRKIAGFYEEEPFPNYDNIFNRNQLKQSAENSKFPKAIYNLIKDDFNVLELGCGTGQLTNYLGTRPSANIIGVDLSKKSLILAQKFKKKVSIHNTIFCRADLFNLPFKKKSFEVVIANGVLHHTYDTWKALESIVPFLKNDGILIMGLYNKFGRLRTNFLRKINNLLGRKFLTIIDPISKKLKNNNKKIESWINDQYFNPIERSHSFDEVIENAKKLCLNVNRFVPDVKNYDVENILDLALNRSLGNRLDRIIVQLNMTFIDHSDGGLFITILKKEK